MGDVADYIFDRGGVPTKELILAASDEIGYYKGSMTESRIQAVIDKCSDYWEKRSAHIIQEGKTPIFLDPKSRDVVKGCVDSLTNNKKVMDILHPKGLISDPISENEQAILLEILVEIPDYDPFTLKIKAKLDNYVIDPDTNSIQVNDIKTLGRILPEFLGNVEKFHYYREMANLAL